MTTETRFRFNQNDGGRAAAGFKRKAGDCGVRAAAIALGYDYAEVHDDLEQAAADYRDSHRNRVARRIAVDGTNPDKGVWRQVLHSYLVENDFKWMSCKSVGQPETVHVRPDELYTFHEANVCRPATPDTVFVLRVSRHFTTVIGGELHDTFLCDRDGTRMVYGYWWRD